MKYMKRNLLVLLIAITFVSGMLYSKTAMAKSKKGVYYSTLTGKKKDTYSDQNIKRFSMKGNKLIVYGNFAYAKSQNKFNEGKTTKLKYKKRIFYLKSRCKMFSAGGEGRPQKLTRSAFLKLARYYNGLGLIITVDKNGRVTKLTISS